TLTLSFSSLSDANEVAILIDGYCMLVNRSAHSLWRYMMDDQYSSALSPPAFLAPHPSDNTLSQVDGDDGDSNGDYADVLSSDYHIDRKQIHMIESLGNGQFGEVYRGMLKTAQQLEINIAIKTCKMQDSETTEAFLEEACQCNAKIRSSTYYQIDWRLYGTSCFAYYGISKIRRG
ncbi:unnamed protein product, partial [Rotaria magnacalcarata]